MTVQELIDELQKIENKEFSAVDVNGDVINSVEIYGHMVYLCFEDK